MRNWLLCGVLLVCACDSDDPNDGSHGGESSGGAITFAVVADGVDYPSDAAPSADGTNVWYVVAGSAEPGLYRVGPGEDPILVSPIADAVSLAVSADDAEVFVGAKSGIYTVVATSGQTTMVAGTENCSVTHLDLAADLVFAGTCGDKVGVFAVAIEGGSVSLEIETATVPSGVFPFEDGSFAVAEGRSVHRRGGPSDVALVEDATLGTPTGMALTPDGGTLMVSSLSAVGSAQVILADLTTGANGIYDEPIKQNKGAGGLHGASNAQVYAWADFTGAGKGKVYKITMD